MSKGKSVQLEKFEFSLTKRVFFKFKSRFGASLKIAEELPQIVKDIPVSTNALFIHFPENISNLIK